MKTKNRLGNNYGDQVKLSQSRTQRHLVGFGLCLDHATKTRLTAANTRGQGTSKQSVHPILPREVALFLNYSPLQKRESTGASLIY